MSDDIFIISRDVSKHRQSSYKVVFTLCLCFLLCAWTALVLNMQGDTSSTRSKTKETSDNNKEQSRETFKAGVVEYAVVPPAQCSKVRYGCILHVQCSSFQRLCSYEEALEEMMENIEQFVNITRIAKEEEVRR